MAYEHDQLVKFRQESLSFGIVGFGPGKRAKIRSILGFVEVTVLDRPGTWEFGYDFMLMD